MSEKDDLWLEQYIRTGDSIQAVRDIFPNCSEASAPSRASQLKVKMESEIDQALTKEIKRQSITAFRIISDLMIHAKQESIKYKCASDILNRGGFAEVHKLEVTNKDETYNDLMNRLKTSLNGLDDKILSEILDNNEQMQYLVNHQAGGEQ